MSVEHYPLTDTDSMVSPSLLYFRGHIEHNITLAIEIAGSPDRLRPHIKTHKTIGLVNMQRARGITKFKCATIAEAEMLAMGGVDDILLAYPVVGANIRRIAAFRAVYRNVSLKVIGDDERWLAGLSDACSALNLPVEVMVDVNVGMNRTGIPVSAVPELYRKMQRMKGIVCAGLHAYDGHIHDSDFEKRITAARTIFEAVTRLRRSLEADGMTVPLVTMGGTPTFPCYARMEGVELSPGTCFLHDRGYADLFPDMPFIPAGLVFTRVIARPTGNTFTLDLGYKGIASDPPGQRGYILGYPHADPLFQSEEHWVFTANEGAIPDIGDELLVVPTHVCPTSALYPEAIVVEEDGSHRETWPILARTRKLFL